ncbi:MAG: polysaccharide deacetylase family protein [Potamolinea sp.]
MADRHLFVRNRWLLIALFTGSFALSAGCSVLVKRATNQASLIPISWPLKQPNVNTNALEIKLFMSQKERVHKEVSDKIAALEKVRRFNIPLPVPFKGKTIHEIEMKSEAKTTTKSELSKQKKDTASRYPIALTFDDGPLPQMTSKVLDVLKKNKIKATFFVVGKQVEQHPNLLIQIVNDGHAVGNHTWSHEYFQYSTSAAQSEIDKTSTLVYNLTGVKISLFRPPAGILTNGLVSYANQNNYATVMWSVDAKDWRYYRHSPQALIDSVLQEAKPGGIILLHDGGGDRSTTIEALPKIITELKKRGYDFVTVPELLAIADKKTKESKD